MYMDMRLQFKNGVTLRSVQNQFNDAFPFLKLEFFQRPGETNDKVARTEKIKTDEFASKYTAPGSNISVEIYKQMTVARLEAEFREKTGLGVQVFRKSGNVWVETSLTNDWTLEQQNREGESISIIK